MVYRSSGSPVMRCHKRFQGEVEKLAVLERNSTHHHARTCRFATMSYHSSCGRSAAKNVQFLDGSNKINCPLGSLVTDSAF